MQNQKPKTNLHPEPRSRESQKYDDERGVTLLLVVVLLSALMSISLGLFNLVFEELLITGETSNSFLALYASDQGLEKTLFRDRIMGVVCKIPPGDPSGTDNLTTDCDGPTTENTNSKTCYITRVSKADLGSGDIETIIDSSGEYPIPCGGSAARAVRRRFRVTYSNTTITLPPNPFAEWKLEDSPGLVAFDTSGNGYNGNLQPLLFGPTWISGIIGGALSFDGTDDFISTPIAINLEMNDFSVSAWIRLPNLFSAGRIVADDNNNLGWALSYGDGFIPNRIRFFVRGMTTISLDADGAIGLPNTWYHVVGVFDNTNNQRFIYVNGAVAASNLNDTGTPSSDPDTLIIGGVSPASAIYPVALFDGDIDQVRLYSRALTPGEINQLFSE